MHKYTSKHLRASLASIANASRKKSRKVSQSKSSFDHPARELSQPDGQPNPNVRSVYFGDLAFTVDVSHHSGMAEDYSVLADELGIVIESMALCTRHAAQTAACSNEDVTRETRAVARALEGIELLCDLAQALRDRAYALNRTAAGSAYSQRGHSA